MACGVGPRLTALLASKFHQLSGLLSDDLGIRESAILCEMAISRYTWVMLKTEAIP